MATLEAGSALVRRVGVAAVADAVSPRGPSPTREDADAGENPAARSKRQVSTSLIKSQVKSIRKAEASKFTRCRLGGVKMAALDSALETAVCCPL